MTDRHIATAIAWAPVRITDGFLSGANVRFTEGGARASFVAGWPEGWKHAYRHGWRIIRVTVTADISAHLDRGGA